MSSKVVTCITALLVSYGSCFWLGDIVEKSNSEMVCYISKAQNDDDVRIFEVVQMVQNDIATSGLVMDKQLSPLDHCEIEDKAVIVIEIDQQLLDVDFVETILESATQSQLRNNLWIFSFNNINEDTGIPSRLVPKMSRKLGLRILVFFVNNRTLRVTQLLGTATEQYKVQVGHYIYRTSN